MKTPCQPIYNMTVEEQNRYCMSCGQNTNQMRAIMGSTYRMGRQGSGGFSDPLRLCQCCNRTGRNDQDSNLVIFLDQDYNDIGHLYNVGW